MKSKIEEIEVLRGIAVMFVVIHHASDNLFTWTTPALSRFYTYFSGWFGVDLFFAISGFVIARDLVPRLRVSTSSDITARIVLAFWIRRAWRLLPSSWSWLAIILIASLAFNQGGAFGTFRINLEATVAGVLQVANVRFADVFMNRPYGASFVYWSLSLEEQFYLLFPFMIVLARRYLAHFLVALVFVQLFSVRTPVLMAFRTDALALGILLALWTQHSTYQLFKPAFLAHWKVGALMLAGILLCMSILGSGSLSVVPIKVGLIALLSVLLVWIASYGSGLLCFGGPLKNLFVWFGGRSYAIYLIHVPVFFFIREVWNLIHPGQHAGSQYFYHFVITAALLICILSEINYRAIESPLRRKGAMIAARMQNVTLTPAEKT